MKPQYVLMCASTLLILGCQKPRPAGSLPEKDPKQYAYQAIHGPTVDEEIKFYEKRCAERPRSWADKNFLAQAYLAKGQAEDNDEMFDKAAATAEESLKIRSEFNVEARLVLAGVAEGHHNFKKSYEICRKLYDADPGTSGLNSMISNSLLEMGQVEEAQTWARPLLEKPITSSVLVHGARLAIYAGQDEEAMRYLKAALKLEQPQERKSSARIRSLWGDIELRHGRLKEARELLEASLKIHQRSLPALLAMARLERREGHPEKALVHLRGAHQHFGNPAILTEMAAMEARLGHADEAVKLRKEAETVLREEVGSGLIGHARDLAKVLLDSGHPQEALKVAQEEEKYRSDFKNYELQAMCHQALKQPREALACMEKALAHGYQDPLLFARAAALAAELKDPRVSEWEKRWKDLDAGATLDQ